MKYQLETVATDLSDAPYSIDNLIDFFPTLKHLYSCFLTQIVRNTEIQNYDKVISQMHSILFEYCMNCQNCYTQSPLAFLRAVRVYRNAELTYLFLFYVTIRYDYCFKNLKKPIEKILKCKNENICFKETNIDITIYYGYIATEILCKPFVAYFQGQISPKTGPPTQYITIIDWEERKKILMEIIFSLKDLLKIATNQGSSYLFMERKIEKYEFITMEFQVDSMGPSLDHSLYIFHKLQSQIDQTDSYEDISPDTKKLLSLFKVYYQNLIRWQFTDPILFPKPMLAIISIDLLGEKEIFNLFKLPVDARLKRAVELLENYQIMDLTFLAKLQKTTFQTTKPPKLIVRLTNLHNLLNLKNVFTPQGEWIVKCYLALKN
jgi:hypothetical protein